MDEMMLNFSETLANFPVNEEKIKNLVNETLTKVKIELIQLINKNKKEINFLIFNNKRELKYSIVSTKSDIEEDYTQKIVDVRNELTQLINTSIANAKHELARMIKKIIKKILNINDLK